MVVDASNVWDCILGRIAVIPFPNHPTFVSSATFRTTGRRWATSCCTKEGTVSIAWVRSGANDAGFFFGPFGVTTRRTCARPCRYWWTSLMTKSWLDGWGWRPSTGPLPTSHGWWMHASECWSGTIDVKNNFRIAIVSPTTGSPGVLFVPPSVVVDIFLRAHQCEVNERSTIGGCKLDGVAIASKAFQNARLKIEGNWITRVYENDSKMMSSTQNASLGTANLDVHGSFI